MGQGASEFQQGRHKHAGTETYNLEDGCQACAQQEGKGARGGGKPISQEGSEEDFRAVTAV